MRNLRSPAVLQLLCAAVIAVACLGVFSTGAWAFNSWITRTPVETLTYGTFTATLDDLTPDDDGQYHLEPGTHFLTLHMQGNVPRYVLLTVTPQGDGAPEAAQYTAASDAETATFTVETDYPLTLTLTVLEEAPENARSLADAQLEFAKPVDDTGDEEAVTTDPTQGEADSADTAPQPETPDTEPADSMDQAAPDTTDEAQPSETPAQDAEVPNSEGSATKTDTVPEAESSAVTPDESATPPEQE